MAKVLSVPVSIPVGQRVLNDDGILCEVMEHQCEPGPTPKAPPTEAIRYKRFYPGAGEQNYCFAATWRRWINKRGEFTSDVSTYTPPKFCNCGAGVGEKHRCALKKDGDGIYRA